MLINIWSFGLSWNRGPCSPPWNQTRLTTFTVPPAPSCLLHWGCQLPFIILLEPSFFHLRILLKIFSVSQTLSEMKVVQRAVCFENNRRGRFSRGEDHCYVLNMQASALAASVHSLSGPRRHLTFWPWIQLRGREELYHTDGWLGKPLAEPGAPRCNKLASWAP